ncbi:UxaA family hydrolase [Alicyclobacillus macrosporangiidus]|uniref:UxaA family hydrolase n=1 Tax=Alicyclobacillus macrosporangiidus TaxID=392015 RepID=UPI0026EBE806|nr:UxaA family hydrolase [Alicyclobacillus macrosporangiidus]
MHKFLIHRQGDHVGVATRDIEANEVVTGVYMDDNSTVELVARSAIPLGHKIALVALAEGDDVIEYGQVIGRTTQPWQPGDYVHTHNIRSKRW